MEDNAIRRTDFFVYENKKTHDLFFEVDDVITYLLDLGVNYITKTKGMSMQDIIVFLNISHKSLNIDGLEFIREKDLIEALKSSIESLKPRSQYRFELVEKSLAIAYQIKHELEKRGW